MATPDSRSDDLTTWFRSLVEVPQVQTKEQEDGSCDEFNPNERGIERGILSDRSAILLGFKTLLAEDSFEDVQASVLVFFLVTVGGLE